MKNSSSLLYGLVLVMGDALALVLAFALAFILRFRLDIGPSSNPALAGLSGRAFLTILVVTIPLWVIVFALMGLYNKTVYERRVSELGRLFVGTTIGVLILLAWEFFDTSTLFSARLLPIYILVIGFLLLVLVRTFVRAGRQSLYNYGIGINNVLLVGNSPVTHELVNILSNSTLSGYKVIGVVSTQSFAALPTSIHYSTFSEALEKLSSQTLHGIIQTELYAQADKNNQIVTYAQEHHVAYRFVPGNSELFVGNIDVDLFHSIPVVAVHQTALTGWGRVAKRLFDIFASGIFLIVLSPVLAIISLTELLSGAGSVFFRQVRLTRFDQEFRVFKFRTQHKQYDGTTPEEAFAIMGKPELSKLYRENGDFLDDDPRLTRLGRFLRKTSLDELPQLFNVIKGDLSLVGPRALIPQELRKFARHHTILSVKSGLTGLAQVSGRRDISFEERRKLDLYYVQNWSFWLDLIILARTFIVVLFGRGAK